MTNLVPLIAPSGVLVHVSEDRADLFKSRGGYRTYVSEQTPAVDLSPKTPRRRTTKKADD